jgi:Tfp pilus assembly protein PilV
MYRHPEETAMSVIELIQRLGWPVRQPSAVEVRATDASPAIGWIGPSCAATRPQRGRAVGRRLPPCGSRRGLTYLETLIGAALAVVIVVSLSAALTHGLQLSRMARARTHVLSAAQAELERLRGVPFEQLQSRPVSLDELTGEVHVDRVAPRQKRVTVSLRRTEMPGTTVVLAADVYQQSLPR